MKRLPLFVMLALTVVLCSCSNQPSKQFKEMENELKSIESQINEISDCDELQMMNFSILGLRSDMDNYRQDSEMSDEEIGQLDGMIDQLEASWNGKWASLECEQQLIDDELDTSGEEEGWTEYMD